MSDLAVARIICFQKTKISVESYSKKSYVYTTSLSLSLSLSLSIYIGAMLVYP